MDPQRDMSAMDAQLERRLLACPQLPTHPSVAAELLARCRAPQVDLPRVVALLSLDPALAARVLKVANAIGGEGRPFDAVPRGAEALGPNALLATALSFSLVRARRRGEAGHDHGPYWRRATATACGARALAEAAGADAAAAWAAGLLQDIGVLALHEVLRREYAALAAEAGEDHGRLLALERDHLGTDHAEVGGLLARAWCLPPALAAAIRRSHAPAAPDAPGAELCAALAGRAADGWVAAGDPIAAALGLAGGNLADALARGRAEAERIELAPCTPAADADEATLMLEQAKETLVLLSFRAARSTRPAQQLLRELEAQRSALEARTHRDPLTGLHNRLWAKHVLRDLFEEARRTDRPLSIALCDIDRFKWLNDGYGPATGDAVLVAVAGALARGVRATDAVVRWGGGEILLALPDTDGAGAAAVSERARRRVARLSLEGPAREPLRVSVSAGFSTLAAGAPAAGLEELVEAADAALQCAKRAGRDRVAASPTACVPAAALDAVTALRRAALDSSPP